MSHEIGVIQPEADRHRIDELDRMVIAVLTQRALVSRQIQDARTSAGGSRIDGDRERLIIERYRTAFGDSGSALADAVLRICRS